MLLLQCQDKSLLNPMLESLAPLALKVLSPDLLHVSPTPQWPNVQFTDMDLAYCCLEPEELAGVEAVIYVPAKHAPPCKDWQLWVDALLAAGVSRLYLVSYAQLDYSPPNARNRAGDGAGDYVNWQDPWAQAELAAMRAQAEGLKLTIFNAAMDMLPQQIPLLADLVKQQLKQRSSCRVILQPSSIQTFILGV